VLNVTSSGGNKYAIPDGGSEVVSLAKSAGVPDHLSVYMSASQQITLPDGTTTDPCSAILLDPAQRTAAVAQIVTELQKQGGFTGVTIDFEEMRGAALKNGLNLFLSELSAALKSLGYTLYVCVMPVTSDGVYFDAYDYKTIGDCADKVILMAHDYAAGTLTAQEMDAGFTATPVTPIYEIYTALQAVTDKETGVSDRSKLVLAINFGSCQWKTAGGKVINTQAYHPDAAAISARLLDPSAVLNYSEKYQNPYIIYHNATDNTENIIWYEDARSVGAKAALARMFGVNGLSFWRLGLIPSYADPADRQIYYDIPAWLAAEN
jgi:spore germination protein YaaH